MLLCNRQTVLFYARLPLVVLFLAPLLGPNCSGQTLEAELKAIPIPQLATAARELGDASRGAVLFHQPQLSCSKCHALNMASDSQLGPDLAALGSQTTDEHLIESVLEPSKLIRKGFETISILSTEDELFTGLVLEQTETQMVLRDLSQPEVTYSIPTLSIEEMKPSQLSLMPVGLVNMLGNKEQFYDLIKFLIEVRDGGKKRAAELIPPESLQPFIVPEYERYIDHAQLIREWNDESFQRGEAIYKRVCANCHGTLDQPGSLPTSLRFGEGRFKNGSDPLSMYRTMTYGFGVMMPQSWMVPSQKYDVIHYIREAFLKNHNTSQFTNVDSSYLARLPKGKTRGPAPSNIEVWSAMDYGPSLAHTYEVPLKKPKSKNPNIAYKGIAVRLDPGTGGVARGQHWMLFDTDTLRMAAGWTSSGSDKSTKSKSATTASQNFIDWRGIQFNGEHGIHPRIKGFTSFTNGTVPGWANPTTGSFLDDQRVVGRDERRYGPLPRDWGRYRGHYHFGNRTIFSYSIGNTNVLESPSIQSFEDSKFPPVFLRSFHIGPRETDLQIQIAEHAEEDAILSFPLAEDQSLVRLTLHQESQVLATDIVAGLVVAAPKMEWIATNGSLRLIVPAGEEPIQFTIWQPSEPFADTAFVTSAKAHKTVQQSVRNGIDLLRYTKGGPPRWPDKLTTTPQAGRTIGSFALDVLTPPDSNPWLAQFRPTGLDFFSDGRIAVCTWDGDCWIAKETRLGDQISLQWQRIASGMFQPLGLKVVGDKIYVTCRDQLTILHDLNGDGETDYYECFNNDHQVTEHFHEFAMGLQTDSDGNFYYAKSGCHGKAAVVPHHGTLLQVSADGSQTTILATGFRAANGVCLNPDGSFVVTDQEGFWNPKNRINWVTRSESGRPNFYGNMLGYHDVTDTSDSAMVPPLCWITNDFDRSPAELLWVESKQWGALNGSLLSLSYGYGKVFLVPHERVKGHVQGGMIELPIPSFPTGVMRGRFSQADGQLYLCGMFAWAGNATQPGGFYRLRMIDDDIRLPLELHAKKAGMELTFSKEIDPDSLNVERVSLKTWSLKRTANYGSPHINERAIPVESLLLSPDGRRVTIASSQLEPTWCMDVQDHFLDRDGSVVKGTIHNTIHELGD